MISCHVLVVRHNASSFPGTKNLPRIFQWARVDDSDCGHFKHFIRLRREDDAAVGYEVGARLRREDDVAVGYEVDVSICKSVQRCSPYLDIHHTDSRHYIGT